MRIIFALTAAALLAGCSNGKWHPENSTLSFSFDTAFIDRTFSHPDEPKTMAPAVHEVGHLADASIRPGRWVAPSAARNLASSRITILSRGDRNPR